MQELQEWLANPPAATTSEILQGAVRDKIAQILRENAHRDPHGRQYFIPPSHIYTSFPFPVVLQILELFLRSADLAATGALPDIARRIAPPDGGGTCSACQHPYCTGRRLLFLGLIAIARESHIQRFHDRLQKLELEHPFQRVCDNLLAPQLHIHLGPSTEHQSHNPPRTSLDGLMTTWSHAERETVKQLFHRVQGHRFERGHGETRQRNSQWKRWEVYPWLELDEGITLPWVSHTQGRGSSLGGPLPNVNSSGLDSSHSTKSLASTEGEFASVWKVKIHEEYHDFGDSNTHFALKTLKEGDPQRTRRAFQKEIEANIRAGSHDRVVTFITVFEHRKRQYLLMPWANHGSLRNLWKKLTSAEEEDPIFPTWCTSGWLLDQCIGLASGLAHIHDPQAGTDSPASPTGMDSPVSPTAPAGNRCRPLQPEPQLHVDIKPENILAFSADDHIDSPVTLKLGDLGLSMKLDPKKGGVPMSQIKIMLSYRPPDKDLGRAYARPQWDTWSLGCSMLELITWFAAGYCGVRKFRRMRNSEMSDTRVVWKPDEEDSFFRLKLANPWTAWIPGVGAVKGAEVKRCVRGQVAMLKEHEKVRMDERLPNLLDFILERMLVIDDGERATAKEVLEGLKGIKGEGARTRSLYSREDSAARGSDTSQESQGSLEDMDAMARSTNSSPWSDASTPSLLVRGSSNAADVAVEPNTWRSRLGTWGAEVSGLGC